MYRQELDMKEKELSRLARIIDKAFRWFPMFREMLRMEKFCAMLGFSREMTESLLVKKEALKCSGKIYSDQHRRNFDIKDDILRVENDPDDESRLNLTINRKPIADWFREQWHRLRYGTRQPQQEEKKSRGQIIANNNLKELFAFNIYSETATSIKEAISLRIANSAPKIL